MGMAQFRIQSCDTCDVFSSVRGCLPVISTYDDGGFWAQFQRRYPNFISFHNFSLAAPLTRAMLDSGKSLSNYVSCCKVL